MNSINVLDVFHYMGSYLEDLKLRGVRSYAEWFRYAYAVRRAVERVAFLRTNDRASSYALRAPCGVSLARFSAGVNPFHSPPWPSGDERNRPAVLRFSYGHMMPYFRDFNGYATRYGHLFRYLE